MEYSKLIEYLLCHDTNETFPYIDMGYFTNSDLDDNGNKWCSGGSAPGQGGCDSCEEFEDS